jgi:hypothetical protein
MSKPVAEIIVETLAQASPPSQAAAAAAFASSRNSS